MKKKKKQGSLFKKSKLEKWRKEWQDMPEFEQENLESYKQVKIHFRNKEDIDKFSELIGQEISPKQKSIWFPKLKIRSYDNKRYVDKDES